MSLDYAILGFLNYHPHCGYELKKIFDYSVRHFWAADQSQIYRTLNRLVERGWAEVEIQHQEDRPDRKVYSITEAGRAELLRWLSGPPPLDPPRSAPLIQVFFSGALTNEQILTQFEGYAAIMRSVLRQYEQIPPGMGEFMESVPSPREHFFWLLTLENGIANMRANLAWAESVIERIRKGEVPD